jgi:phage anti-repressor protein
MESRTMNELIKITNDKVDGRELYEFLEVKTPYTTWFERMCEYGFTEGVDFNPNKNVRVQIEGGREVHREIESHEMTVDMAKEISMLQRTERGKQARQYFIECEKQAKALSKPKTTAELLVEHAQAYLEHERRMAQIEATQSEQEQRLLEIESKQMTIDKNHYTIIGYANLMGIRGVDRDVAAGLGRKASKLSHKQNYHVGKEYDAKYGAINTYHVDILQEIFRSSF